MRAMNRALISLSSLCLVSAAVAQQTQLQPMDMFRLNYRMNAGAEDPVAWLDANSYLVFDAGKGGRGAPSWSRVDARSGDRNSYLDNTALRASLSKSIDAGELANPAAWLWNEDHTRFEKFLKENL